MKKAAREIINELLTKTSTSNHTLHKIKSLVAAKQKLDHTPSNAEIIRYLKPNERKKLLKILRRKKTRTISGVSVIAIMTKQY